MSKYMAQADFKDRQILYQLDLDARQSFTKIGKKIGLSKEVVGYRVKRLQRLGIIKGFYTLIDMGKLGYLSCRFFLKFMRDPPQKEDEIIQYFVEHPSYWWVDSADGIKDLGAVCLGKNVFEIHGRRAELMEKFRGNIKELSQAIYTAFYVYRRAYLANKKVSDADYTKICYNGTTASCDKTDLKILKLIAGNARMPTIEIAKNVGVSETAVKYRVGKMLGNGIIQGFRAMLDLNKIGYYWYKIEFELEDYARKEEMLKFFEAHPNIVYAYETIGGPDLEVELEVESYEKFRQVLNEIREKFSDTILSYRHLLWFREHKIVYFPMQ
jgi:Lrp/AsnC family transcriptional regulator for asnA, asnC and gidA